MSEHAPGPWVVKTRDGYTDVFDETTGGLLASTSGAPANALLIAAAPDLLAACRMILEPEDGIIFLNQIRAAVCKATGEPMTTDEDETWI